MINSLKSYWVCVGRNDNTDYSSIAYNRKTSIRKCLEYTTLTWQEMKLKYGWKCVKVNILFDEVKPKPKKQ